MPGTGVHKQLLMECLGENNINWVSDRSNHDPSFFRVQIRQLLLDAFPLGLSPTEQLQQDILQVMTACRTVKHRIESRTWNLFQQSLIHYHESVIHFRLLTL